MSGNVWLYTEMISRRSPKSSARGFGWLGGELQYPAGALAAQSFDTPVCRVSGSLGVCLHIEEMLCSEDSVCLVSDVVCVSAWLVCVCVCVCVCV